MRMTNILRIPLEGALGVRDLGGLPAADGRTVRPGRLIRSGQLCRLTERDKRQLIEAYGLRQVIDLRTEAERAACPEPEWPGVHMVSSPIKGDASGDLALDADGTVERLLARLDGGPIGALLDGAYARLALDLTGQASFARFFGLLLEQREGATLWHGTLGKDRTGVAAALLLTALGVPREQVIADYLAAGEMGAGALDEALRRLADAPEPLRQATREAYGVRPSNIEAFLSTAESRFGSMSAYLNEALGLDNSRVQALRSLYLI